MDKSLQRSECLFVAVIELRKVQRLADGMYANNSSRLVGEGEGPYLESGLGLGGL